METNIDEQFCLLWGSYPWPNTNGYNKKKEKSDYEREIIIIIDKSKQIASDWLFDGNENKKYGDEEKQLIYSRISKEIAGWNLRMQDKINEYISWMGWHEGLIDKD